MAQLNIAILSLFLIWVPFGKVQSQAVFDVTKYGAKPNSDIGQAVDQAWKEACASASPSKLVIPKETYTLGQVTFQGPCKAAVEVQVQGTLKAPTDTSAFKGAGSGWITFQNTEHLTVSGGGTFDGQGGAVWGKECGKNSYCKNLPLNLVFNSITNSMVQDVTTKDSKQFHVNVLSCKNITFERFTVSAPENSLNTDGIHIGRSNGVTVRDCNIGTGDDCVSLGDGNTDITVNKVKCGPGHGISVGSLGRNQGEQPVTGVKVTNCTISNTQNGVRIKTWPASFEGTVSDIHFDDIIMNNVSNPIIVDQMYCPWNECNPKIPSKVKLSNIGFKNIKGTSASEVAVKISCSSGVPCDKVQLADIDLSFNGGVAKSQCSNVKPEISGKQNPPACTAPSPTP